MLRSPLTILAITSLLGACAGTPQDSAVVPKGDVRIDQAPQEADPDSKDPQMCVNDNGEIFVVWVDDRDGTDDIWFNRSTNLGQDWLLSATKLNRGQQNGVWAPAIACNNKGVYVVWEDDRDGELQNHNIYFNRSTDSGETWLEQDVLLELDDEGRSFSQGPQITSVGDDLYAVWYDNLNGAADILSVASGDNGETWRDPVRVDSDEPAGIAFSGSPQVAATETGKVYVTWEDTRDGNSDVYFARSDNAGNGYKPDTRLDGGDEAGSEFSFQPQIGADEDDVYVVWHDARDGDGGSIYMNYSSNGGADWFGSAARVEQDESQGNFNSLFPKVVVTGARGHIAWYDNTQYNDPSAEAYDIWYRAFDAGNPVADMTRLSQPELSTGQGNSTNVQMATNGAEVLVAWEDQRDGAEAADGYNDLYYNYIAGGNPQTEDFRIDTFYPANSFKKDLRVALHGNLVFSVWTDGREGTSDVFFKALPLGEAGETLEQGEQ